jgi:hypothetical protein
LGIFAHVAWTVALAGLPPSAFIERNAKHREVSLQFVEVGLVREM